MPIRLQCIRVYERCEYALFRRPVFQVTSTSGSCDFFAAHWRLIQRTLSSMINSWLESLDYCNNILANAPLGLQNCLQSMIRSSALLVLRIPLWAGRWVQADAWPAPLAANAITHITFTLCTMAHKCIHSLAPSTSPGCVLPLYQ